jgi:hypothetical protein
LFFKFLGFVSDFQKKHVVCNPDSGLLVALTVPRSAFLAYFQPAGASRSLEGSNSEKRRKNT